MENEKNAVNDDNTVSSEIYSKQPKRSNIMAKPKGVNEPEFIEIPYEGETYLAGFTKPTAGALTATGIFTDERRNLLEVPQIIFYHSLKAKQSWIKRKLSDKIYEELDEKQRWNEKIQELFVDATEQANTKGTIKPTWD